MSFGLLNLWMLAGLGAVAIPPLIHLLNRRRFTVVDWGAMQFLQVSETTRRRLLIEEILLMLLRMGLIALLVLALAAPYAVSPLLAEVGGRANRDVVLLLDGSASMSLLDEQGRPVQDKARSWAESFLNDLRPGDRVTLLQAGEQGATVLEPATHDLDRVRTRLAKLAPPRGGCDWPAAIAHAQRLLAAPGGRPESEIILLTDGQRFGWADPEALFRWEMLATRLRSEAAKAEAAGLSRSQPRTWVVNVRRNSPNDAAPVNYTLAPLQTTRALAWAGQQLTFKSALSVSGPQEYEPPHRLRLEVDGKPAGEIAPPPPAELAQGQLPFTFSYRFNTPGSHLLSVIVDPDLPTEKRPSGYRLKDRLPPDNRQDFAVEVVDSLPVLLVDGDRRLSPQSSTYFLQKALAQSPDPERPPVVLTRAVPVKELDPEMLGRDLDPARPGSRPRVLVLADVPRLNTAQQQAVERFLADGGGVLVFLGERVEGETAFYNEHLFGARGWLPARIDRLAGDRKQPEFGAVLEVKRATNPALELFREEPNCTLGKVRLPRWWQVTPATRGRASVGAWLSTGDPLLVEQAHKKGRVLLWTGPLDRSWGAAWPSVWEFPVLAHELVYYLADARSVEHNLKPGQPLRYAPEDSRGRDENNLPAELKLYPPLGDPVPLKVEHWPLVDEGIRDVGVYRLEIARDKVQYYVVQPDARESDLTPATAEDRKKVADLVPVEYQSERQPVARAMVAASQTQELWCWLLAGVVVLLCSEVWMTRRMARRRELATD
jgi:hypothetical protein